MHPVIEADHLNGIPGSAGGANGHNNQAIRATYQGQHSRALVIKHRYGFHACIVKAKIAAQVFLPGSRLQPIEGSFNPAWRV